jgi:LmbE family N-acetylglucosaminyl deacetylase
VTCTALAVSPHLDDAAFSAGGTLAWLAKRGWQVVVATVFTATVPSPTGFALRCQTDKGVPPEADYMAIRRAEDQEAGAALGARMLHLPLREAPHRGYADPAALFGPLHPADSPEPVAAALRPLLAGWQPTLILAPQALGGHVDHVLTVLALQDLAPSVPVLWWQDFPYLRREDTPRRPFAKTWEALPDHVLPSVPGRKHRACLAYASQLGYQFGGPDGLARALADTGGVERMRLQGSAAFLSAAA